jgi:hypothetical protein
MKEAAELLGLWDQILNEVGYKNLAIRSFAGKSNNKWEHASIVHVFCLELYESALIKYEWHSSSDTYTTFVFRLVNAAVGMWCVV